MINNFIHSHKLVNYGSLRERANNSITELVSLAEAKEHLRIDSSFTNDDTYITTLISVSRAICESYVGFTLATNTALEYHMDKFPDNEVIYLYGVYKPGNFVINYYDNNDSQQVLSNTLYNVDTRSIPTRVFLKENNSFPSTSDSIPSAIKIDLAAGPTVAQELPRPIYQAILLTIGHLYENRQNVIVGGGKPYDVPQTAEHLMNPYRVVVI
jgi:uncharacterized phiE125 gp8 family phage protein